MSWQIDRNKGLFVVKNDPTFEIEVSPIPGADHEVRLSLATRNHRALSSDLEALQQGTNLAICLDQEAALKLYSRLRKLILGLGWPLPTEDESQA